MSSKRLGQVMPLQVFIRRAQVLKLYRTMLRLTKPFGERKEQNQQLRVHIRDRFHTYKQVDDAKLIATLLTEGQRQLVQLEAVVQANDAATNADSWINTKDDKDQRGRVGEGWPWEH